MAEKIFTIKYDGLELLVKATDVGGGELKIEILCVEGFANINAFYWSDGDDNAEFDGLVAGPDATLGKKDASLNMNGTDVDWDGGIKLSDSGLGKTPPKTYLTKGESYCFTISASLADLDTIGIRATSTSTAEGSIKGVAQEDDDDDDNHFPDFANDISHVDFYFDLDGNVDNGAEFIVRVNTTKAVDDDLDNWYEDAVDYIKAQYAHLADAELLGAAIWGGNLFPDDDPNGKKYYYALDGDPNPDDPIAPGIVAKNIVDDDPDYGVQGPGGFGFGGTGINNLVLHYDGNVFQEDPFA